MPLRPWALRNIREQSLPRTQLRTVDTQAERHLAALNLAPIKSDDPVLGRIEAASSVASHQRNGVRYPRKLKQIRRVQICEYEAMEELVGQSGVLCYQLWPVMMC